MKTRFLATLLLMLVALLGFSDSATCQIKDTTLAGPSIKTMYSKILGENRKIFIQTPTRMRGDEAYPVLYLMDGEALTEMVAGQIRYLSDSYKIIPAMIVVSIENTDRTRDLTPSHSIIANDGKPDTSATAFGKRSGGGEKFLQFIKEELMPFVQANYNTAPYRILAGHSLGGLMAVHCLIYHPEYFNAYIAISPSLQWDQGLILKQATDKLGQLSLNKRLLFFSNGSEDNTFQAKQLKLDSILKRKDISGLKHKYIAYPGESHTASPVKAIYDGIRFIYPEWFMPLSYAAFRQTFNSDSVSNHYARLSANYGYTVIPAHDEINQICRFLRNDPKRIADAIALLKMNAINYPVSAVVCELLGDVYLKMDDRKNADMNYRKALSIQPANINLKVKIKTLTDTASSK
jgi:predicted alpha/beta superfamily hydrolase